MARSKKWEEIYKQTNEGNLADDPATRFLVFVSIGDVKALATTVPRTAGSALSNGSTNIVECWVRATLCDADGNLFEDEIPAESRHIPLTDTPSFGMVPIMAGDSHRIQVSIDDLEETFLKLEFIYEVRRKSSSPISEQVVVGFEEVSLFTLSPMGDPLTTTIHLKTLRGDGSKREACELSVKMKLSQTKLNNERLKECKNAFEAFDLDSSGTISSSELKSALEHIGISCSDSQVEAMISHVDENSTNEIEIHEFINLMDSFDDSLGGLDAVIENIARNLAFNIEDVSSKYESHGHVRKFKQHRSMLTLSGRRSLLHENNYVNNKPMKNNALLVDTDETSTLEQREDPFFTQRAFSIGRLITPSPLMSKPLGEPNDGITRPRKTDSFNMETKADYWHYHNKGKNRSSFHKLKEKPCEELDKIAAYLDQNFDRALFLLGKRQEHLIQCFKIHVSDDKRIWCQLLDKCGILQLTERLIRHLSSCLGHALLSVSKAAVLLYHAHVLASPQVDAFITQHRKKVHYELFEEAKPPVLPDGLLEGLSLVKYQLITLQESWRHFVQQRLDRNNTFAQRLLAPVHSSRQSPKDELIQDILKHVITSAKALITMDELTGDAAGVCEETCLLLRDSSISIQKQKPAVLENGLSPVEKQSSLSSATD